MFGVARCDTRSDPLLSAALPSKAEDGDKNPSNSRGSKYPEYIGLLCGCEEAAGHPANFSSILFLVERLWCGPAVARRLLR